MKKLAIILIVLISLVGVIKLISDLPKGSALINFENNLEKTNQTKTNSLYFNNNK